MDRGVDPRRNKHVERNEMVMQLWTVIDGEIYLEENVQKGSEVAFRKYP